MTIFTTFIDASYARRQKKRYCAVAMLVINHTNPMINTNNTTGYSLTYYAIVTLKVSFSKLQQVLALYSKYNFTKYDKLITKVLRVLIRRIPH